MGWQGDQSLGVETPHSTSKHLVNDIGGVILGLKRRTWAGSSEGVDRAIHCIGG